MKTRKIILVSASPRRRKLLRQMKIKFVSATPKIDEDLLISRFHKKGFKKLVEILSIAKALSVLGNNDLSLNGDELILGFDTVVVCDKKILGKPKNRGHALKMLLSLSNKFHVVCTGIAMIDLEKKRIFLDHEITKVFMKKITKKEALRYIKTSEPLDKAGAYAIQGRGKKFVKKIDGDYHNVVGFPLKKFLKMLNMSQRAYEPMIL